MTGDRLRQAADALNQGVARRVEGGEATAFQATLSAAARGDEDAFGALWHRAQPALLHYLKVIAPDAAEDLAAETWLQVVAGLGRFRGDEAAFRVWMFTIARNQAIHRPPKPGREAPEVTTELTAPDPSAATSKRATLALIATLPPDQAEVVTLRIIGGLDVAEVAKVTGKRPSTVRVLTHRALRRLSEQLDATSAAKSETPRTRPVPVEQVQPSARRVEGGQATAFQSVLSAATHGDEDAFGVLWRKLQPALLRYFTVVAPNAAEDLATETWLQVVRGLGRFHGDEAAFRAWVFTIARHEVLDWRRRATRSATETTAEQTTTDPSATSSRTVLALINTLPPDQAEVVTLRIIGGLDVAEVAKVTGKRPSTVRVLTHRALRRLAKQVDPTGGGGRQDHDLVGRKAVPVEGSNNLGPDEPVKREQAERLLADVYDVVMLLVGAYADKIPLHLPFTLPPDDISKPGILHDTIMAWATEALERTGVPHPHRPAGEGVRVFDFERLIELGRQDVQVRAALVDAERSVGEAAWQLVAISTGDPAAQERARRVLDQAIRELIAASARLMQLGAVRAGRMEPTTKDPRQAYKPDFARRVDEALQAQAATSPHSALSASRSALDAMRVVLQAPATSDENRNPEKEIVVRASPKRRADPIDQGPGPDRGR